MADDIILLINLFISVCLCCCFLYVVCLQVVNVHSEVLTIELKKCMFPECSPTKKSVQGRKQELIIGVVEPFSCL